jgi:ferrochelatase
MPLASDLASAGGDRHASQQPDEEPSLATRNNGDTQPAAEPAPAGRREALLLLSFGGPEGPDDVLPFLENVTGGRGVPRERLLAVAEHYQHFGGVSPINEQNKALLAAIEADFAEHGVGLPVYWGNRNWAPYVADAWRQMAEDGVQHVYVFATSAYASYSGCRQYHEDVARARAALGAGAPTAEKLPHYFDAPGFVRANADALRTAIGQLPEGFRDSARLVATAHSIPEAMAAVAGPDGGAYQAELRAAAQAVVDAVAPGRPFDLVWQSRSGPPSVPWLEPDINDHLRTLAAQGVDAVVVAPTGFVSDHIEVLWDLDNEAEQTASELGVRLARAATAGTHPAFVSAIRELVAERVLGTEAKALGSLGLCGIVCPDGCCPAPRRAAAVP